MTEERVQRRLAAILVADVVGYSRLIETDEEGTRARLRSLHTELINPRIAADSGRIVKTSGDGILVEFGSAVDAVRNALGVQRAMQQHNADLPEDRKIEFRVGINLGDVIVEGDDIHGDGVNVAARLEGLCGPGEVYVSGTVHDHVEGKLAATFDDLGEQTIKNIAKLVQVYRVRDVTGKQTSQTSADAPPKLPDKPSIAVLPFTNISGEPEQEVFADGMAEDIITALSKNRWFLVIARNSTFTYKGKAVKAQQVAMELGVRYVLEGSIQRAGDRIRVNAQLIDAETGTHIWAERYDRNLEDIFALQDEITEQIVSSIAPELGTAERERARRKPPESLDAWDRFQRGLWHVYRVNKHDHSEAERLMRDVTEIDPGFSPAYAYLALIRYFAVIHGFAEDDAKTLAEGHALGNKAVNLDRNDPVAHFALARVLTIEGDTEAAIVECKIAIDLNPNDPHGHHGLGWALYWGRADAEAALEHLNTALRLNPRDPLRWITLMLIGASFRFLKRYDEAIEWGRAACQYSTEGDFLPHLHMAATFGLAGRIDDAKAAKTNALELRPELTIAFMSERYSTLHSGMRDSFFEGLRKAGLPE